MSYRLLRNPWVAIMRAAERGNGLHLSADEVYALSRDSAIEACAENDLIEIHGGVDKLPDWKDVDPKKYPINKSITL